MYLVTAKVAAWEEDFPGSRVEWKIGQSREVHDSLVSKFRNNPASWTVSGGSDSSPMQATKTLTGGIEVFGMVVVGGLSSNAADASANVALIQKALDTGGQVMLCHAGSVYIDDTLKIGSNTKLTIGKSTKLVLTGGTCKPLVKSMATDRIIAGGNAVTLSWTSGRLCSVAWVGHGRSVGEYAVVYGSTLAPSAFSGVFQIVSVTDSDNFVVRLHRTPSTSPTGSALAVLADSNIEVEGGIFDMAYPSVNTGGTNYQRHAILMCGVAHLRVHGQTFKNVQKYGMQTNGTYDSKISDISGDITLSDGVKVYGPAVLTTVENVSGLFGDDVVSLQTKEPPAYIGNQLLWGDMINPTVRGISASSTVGTGVVALYPSASEYTGGVYIGNVTGKQDGGAGVALLCAIASSSIDDITIENVSATGAANVRLNGTASTTTINSMTIRGMKLEPADYASLTSGNLMSSDATWAIKTLNLYDIAAVNSAWNLASNYIVSLACAITTLNVNGANISLGANNCNVFQLNGAVEKVNLDKVLTSGTVGTLLALSAGTPTVSITNSDINSYGCLATTVACDINFTGNRFNVGANGIVRSNAAVAINIRSGGNKFNAGSLYTVGSGTAALGLYGFDLPIDVGGSGAVKTTSGQYCYNTGAARGALTQNRLVTCNGTNWVQVDTPANVF